MWHTNTNLQCPVPLFRLDTHLRLILSGNVELGLLAFVTPTQISNALVHSSAWIYTPSSHSLWQRWIRAVSSCLTNTNLQCPVPLFRLDTHLLLILFEATLD